MNFCLLKNYCPPPQKFFHHHQLLSRKRYHLLANLHNSFLNEISLNLQNLYLKHLEGQAARLPLYRLHQSYYKICLQ